MPTTVIDGIATRYEVIGSGPPLLMFAPAGFDASMDKWRTTGVYTRIKPLDHLPAKYSCIIFDRRETGQSGGRIERITWAHYVAQGKGLLDHLGHKRAHLMGGCMGCSPVMAFGVMHPEMVQSMVLYWPVGGAKYRISTHQRFVQHLAYVNSVRDTSPGAEPEDLMRLDIPALVVPGRDASHATSAARYVEECLPKSEYWDVPPAEQTEATAPARILKFLDGIEEAAH